MSDYTVRCPCGAETSVAQKDAGTELICECGNSVRVPRLSALKRAAGESNRTTIEEIAYLCQLGELPPSVPCPATGDVADCEIHFHVQCERSWVRGGEQVDFGQILGFYLLFGWVGAIFASRRMKPREEFGRETAIVLPLRVATSARGKIASERRQAALKSLLCKIPIYAKLLEDYPEAEVAPYECS